MKQKKHAHMVLVVIILIGAFLIIRSAIVSQMQNNARDADFAEDALLAAACTPPKITNVSVGNISSTGATISWTTNQISTSVIKLSSPNSGAMNWLATIDSPAQTSGVTAHSYPLSNLQPGAVYSYRVRSSNGQCQKTSSTYTFQTLSGGSTSDTTPPTVPGNLSVAPGTLTDTSVTLTWNASTDPGTNPSGVKNYEVYGPTGACNAIHYNGLPSAGFCGFVTHTGASTYSLAISGLQPNTTYSGNTGANAGFVAMAFDNANNNSSPNVSRLGLTTLSSGQTDVCPNIAGIQTSVPAGMIIDSNGNCVTPPDTTPPSTPTGLNSPSQTTTSISLSWSASTDNVGVTGYRIYQNGSSTPVAGSIGTTATITGLSPATSYTYVVRAIDSAGNLSAPSSSIVATTGSIVVTDTQPPTRPGNVGHTSLTSTSVVITWSASSDDTLTPSQITYDIYGPTSACNVPVNGTPIPGYCGEVVGTPSKLITGLTPGTAYDQSGGIRGGFIIQAHDNVGHYSQPSVVYTAVTTPGAPQTLSISNLTVSNTTTNSATISWTTNIPASTVLNFGLTSNYGQTVSLPALVTSHSVTTPANLLSGTTYQYRVTSVDSGGNSVSSPNNSFQTESIITSGCTTSIPLVNQRQMWIWKDNAALITAGSSAQNQLFNFIDSKNINMIYLNAPASFLNSSTNRPKIRDFLNTLWNDHCTKVQWLDGDPSWINPTWSSARAWVDAAKSFETYLTNNSPSNVHPYGLNVDVEPYSAITSSAGRTNYVNMYLDMKSRLAGTGLKLVGVIPRWYDTSTNIDPSSSVRIAFMQSLINAVDEIAIMNYVTNSSSFVADAQTELAYAQSVGKKVVLGAETIDLTNFGGGNGTTSFWTRPNACSDLNNMFNNSYSALIGIAPTQFGGFAVHSYYDTPQSSASPNGSGWKVMCP